MGAFGVILGSLHYMGLYIQLSGQADVDNGISSNGSSASPGRGWNQSCDWKWLSLKRIRRERRNCNWGPDMTVTLAMAEGCWAQELFSSITATAIQLSVNLQGSPYCSCLRVSGNSWVPGCALDPVQAHRAAHCSVWRPYPRREHLCSACLCLAQAVFRVLRTRTAAFSSSELRLGPGSALTLPRLSPDLALMMSSLGPVSVLTLPRLSPDDVLTRP
ncbi:hypothetical protein NFI96_021246 [Prochilodus magdalenae]|nr:hypothetical protein NFI96_021246 [Prochilodus magdalenae]